MSNSERQDDELLALSAIYADDITLPTPPPSAATQAGRDLILRVGAATLYLHLPRGYPADEPLHVSSASHRDGARLVGVLREAARERVGCECVAELAQLLADELDGMDEPAAGSAVAPATEPRAPQLEDACIRIDHMRQQRAYTKHLHKWSSQLGLTVRVFYRDDERMARDIIVALRGASDSISAFLLRLRTEYVDVDSRGKRCLERKSTVLCRRPSSLDIRWGEPWAAEPYTSEASLELLLESIGLLHVGRGAQRFGSTLPQS